MDIINTDRFSLALSDKTLESNVSKNAGPHG